MNKIFIQLCCFMIGFCIATGLQGSSIRHRLVSTFTRNTRNSFVKFSKENFFSGPRFRNVLTNQRNLCTDSIKGGKEYRQKWLKGIYIATTAGVIGTASAGWYWYQKKRTVSCRSVLDGSFAEFVLQHQPPDFVIAFIKDNRAYLSRRWYGRLKDLPGIFAKGDDVKRVLNARVMKECIEKYHLDLLDVPHKYIYEDIGNNVRVFVEYIESENTDKYISLEEVQQLTKLIEETGFSDWYGGNWIRRASDGKLVCIDTEDNSFSSAPRYKLLKHFMHYMKTCLTDQARLWLRGYVQKLKHEPPVRVIGICEVTDKFKNEIWDFTCINRKKGIYI